MAGLPPRIGPNPPVIHYPELTKSLTEQEALPLLSTYLEKSREAAYLHPDAWLFSDGVQYGPKAGPSGGWALHHLRRIEAGLRGEKLEVETEEELIAKFGEENVPGSSHMLFAPSQPDEETNIGDYTRVDNVIAESQARDEKKMKKRAKKAKVEREKAAKRVKLDDSDAGPSGANTPYQDSMFGYGDLWQTKKQEESDEWQDKAEYDAQQTVLTGDIADRNPSHGRQISTPPVVVKHEVDGGVIVPRPNKTAKEKAARNAAKKARRNETKHDEVKNEIDSNEDIKQQNIKNEESAG